MLVSKFVGRLLPKARWLEQEEKNKEGLDALARLEGLEQVRIENALYLSEEIDRAVDHFISSRTKAPEA